MSTQGVRTRVWRNGTLEAENFPLEQVSDYLEEPDCLVWADICGPDEHDLMQLGEELGLDRHAIEDAVAEHERPKATRYATHLSMTAYAVKHNRASTEFTIGRVSAFSLPRGFVTVRLDPTFDIEEVVRRWDDNGDLIKYGPRALIHGLLDVIVDGYFEAVESLDDEIEMVEDELFDESPRIANELQRHTFALRKSLVQARRAILPMREVVNTVMRAPGLGGRPQRRAGAVLRGSLRPRATSGRMDRVPARHDHLYLRDELVALGCPHEPGHEEADVVGGDHRRSDRDNRVLRPERSLPRLLARVRLLPEHRVDTSRGRRALRAVQTQGLALIGPVPSVPSRPRPPPRTVRPLPSP